MLLSIEYGTIACQTMFLDFQVDTRPVRDSTILLVIPSITDWIKVGAWSKIGIMIKCFFLAYAQK